MNLNVSVLQKFVWKSQAVAGFGYQQVRNKWANWLMIRDVKRRRMSAENFLERSRINAIRKNDILPIEIREIADKDINKFEMNAIPMRINNRCAITSRELIETALEDFKSNRENAIGSVVSRSDRRYDRPRGIVKEWRMSRIVWRHLADYNKLSGVQRAMWG